MEMGDSLLFYPSGLPCIRFSIKVKIMKRFKNTPYFVTEDGQVFREGKTKPLKPDQTNGYLRVTLCIEGKTQRFLVHRMVAETYFSNPKNLEQVNHLDGNRSNNHTSNLEWCTRSENMLHCHGMGTCSNLIASKQASFNKMEETKKKFSELLGADFIRVENISPRNYIHYRCHECKRELRSRTDSQVWNTFPVVCRYCK